MYLYKKVRVIYLLGILFFYILYFIHHVNYRVLKKYICCVFFILGGMNCEQMYIIIVFLIKGILLSFMSIPEMF